MNRQKTYSYDNSVDISTAYDAQVSRVRSSSLPDKDLLDLMSGASVNPPSQPGFAPPQAPSMPPPPVPPTGLATWDAFGTSPPPPPQQPNIPFAVAQPVPTQPPNQLAPPTLSPSFGGMSVMTQPGPTFSQQGGVVTSQYVSPPPASSFQASFPAQPSSTLRPPTPPVDLVNLDDISKGSRRPVTNNGNPFNVPQGNLGDMKRQQQGGKGGQRMPFNSPMGGQGGNWMG